MPAIAKASRLCNHSELSLEALQHDGRFAKRRVMSKFEPEIIRVREPRVACDGSGDIPAALGHPKVWLQIDEKGYVDCGYCDRRFVMVGGPADNGKV